MKLNTVQRSRIGYGIASARKSAAFAEGPTWLTYYLFGPPEKLAAAFPTLADLRCSNLNGEEGGFVYAKQPLDLTGVTAQIDEMLATCDAHAIGVAHIDLDTSPDVAVSIHQCLIRFD